MKAPTISTSDARTLRRGALAMFAIVAIGKGVPALRGMEANAIASADEAARELATLRAAATGHGPMRDSLTARRRRLQRAREELSQAASPQLAAAELATTLGEYATRAGARVNATIVRADSAFMRGFARISVRLSIATDIQGIAALLQLIESDPWLLAVRELTIGGNDPGAHEARAEVLTSELVVECLSRAEDAKPQGARRAK